MPLNEISLYRLTSIIEKFSKISFQNTSELNNFRIQRQRVDLFNLQFENSQEVNF